ncbi:hypothetical protein [Lacimicrobium alkaliphilum]|uniref:Uncharacterized protein n=1 Tax=Lacimicrobium alkaliphilum TaxID=1526571 RepID=A0ABQ1RQS2_9ALTE|nr:hypothetical protein [Lacimicrobium alkaliphilum]GGD78656.1 hypothetical protein GCM10011357_37050 [Lacimicrobium alkaliphilum]
MQTKNVFKSLFSFWSSRSLPERFYLVLVTVLLVCLLNYAALFGPDVPDYGKSERQTVATEFRAAWIASVANINWPSEPGLSSQEQKQEAITLIISAR